MNDNDVNVSGLVTKLGLNRRQFLAATTGMAAAAAVTAPSALAATGSNGVLVPRASAASSSTPCGTPSAATRHVRPRLRLQGGLRGAGEDRLQADRVRRLQPERQRPRAATSTTLEGAALLRTWLDDNGLEAEGNHGSIPGTITDATIAAFDAACEIANILGMGHIGTGSDPTGSAYVADWELAAERWNFFGRGRPRHGLKLYTHNHDIAYSFLLDSGPLDALGRPTRSSGVRRLEHFLANTDPAYVFLEMDIYWAHVAQYRHHTYTAPDGSSVQDIFDPAATVAAQTTRFPLFHAKDGAGTTPWPTATS